MKVAVFETEEWEHQACLRLRPSFDVACTREALTLGNVGVYHDSAVVSPFVNSRLTADVLGALPALRMIATRSTGYDHIDLAYCRAHGIVVSNVPNYGDSTVAEHAFALLLGLSRRLVDAVGLTRRGAYDREGLRGFDLFGRTIGIVGTGRIGRRAIRIAQGFGMRVVACDTNPDEAAAKELGFAYVPLDQLLAEADVVSLHVPGSPGQPPLIGERELSMVRPGAILINTARGSLVELPALIRALRSGRLGGAGLDVLPQEPLLRDEAEVFRDETIADDTLRTLLASNVLLQFPNVLVTPHNAYNTEDAVHRIIESSLANIEAFARGVPVNVVP